MVLCTFENTPTSRGWTTFSGESGFNITNVLFFSFEIQKFSFLSLDLNAVKLVQLGFLAKKLCLLIGFYFVSIDLHNSFLIDQDNLMKKCENEMIPWLEFLISIKTSSSSGRKSAITTASHIPPVNYLFIFFCIHFQLRSYSLKRK